MADHTQQPPLGLVAHRLVDLFETVLREGGNPHRESFEPPRVVLTDAERRQLVLARDAALRTLRASVHERVLVDKCLLFAVNITSLARAVERATPNLA